MPAKRATRLRGRPGCPRPTGADGRTRIVSVGPGRSTMHPRSRVMLVLVFGVAVTALAPISAPGRAVEHIPSNVLLFAQEKAEPFRGRVEAPRLACRDHRKVKVFRHSTHRLVGQIEDHPPWQVVDPEAERARFLLRQGGAAGDGESLGRYHVHLPTGLLARPSLRQLGSDQHAGGGASPSLTSAACEVGRPDRRHRPYSEGGSPCAS
jgi:hypothetical protein